MISFIISFFALIFLFRGIGAIATHFLQNKQKASKQNNSAHFFFKMMNEMMENLKNQQAHFNNHNQYQNSSNSYSRQNSSAGGTSYSASLSRKEALEILGLNGSESEEQIKSCYRNLMLKFHPDTGGNEYFCRKLTDAKNLLLKK